MRLRKCLIYKRIFYSVAAYEDIRTSTQRDKANRTTLSRDLKDNPTYTPKPNRNRTEKIKCLKPYERFHICAETETEPKPNAEPKTCTNLILFFSVSVAEFQQIRQVILIKSAHTQPYALYIT